MIDLAAPVPEWPEQELEYLRQCPICGSQQRSKLYDHLHDRLFGAPGRWTLYLCERCESGYLDPRPKPEAIGKAYARYVTHEAEPSDKCVQSSTTRRLRISIRNGYLNRRYGYSAMPAASWGYAAMILLPPPFRLEWDHYARHLPQPEPGRNRLLDVGCGNGEFLLRAQQAGWEVEGLDFDPKAAAIARNSGLKVWSGDYRQAPFAEESFDAITSNQVAEHVHSPPDFIARLSSWLKPDATLWIGTPNFSGLGRRIFNQNWKLLHPPQHLTLLSANALLELYRKNGLSPRLCRRGFFEKHMFSESLALQHGAATYEELLTQKKHFQPFIQAIVLELITCVLPQLGSDMVVVGKKRS